MKSTAITAMHMALLLCFLACQQLFGETLLDRLLKLKMTESSIELHGKLAAARPSLSQGMVPRTRRSASLPH